MPATRAATTAIKAICQPGMPPTTTVRTTVAGAGAGLPPEPPTGITVVDAEALPAKPRPMATRLASISPSRRRLLKIRMTTFPLPGCDPGRDRRVAYPATLWPGHLSRIGTIPQIRVPGSLDFGPGHPRAQGR